MDGSCDPEGVIPNGASSASSDTALLLEERGASVDGQGTESDKGSLEVQICADFSKLVNLGMKKGLQKSLTFPPAAGEGAEQDDNLTRDADQVLKDAPAYERSMSLPPTLKPISALKGSRQKNGITALMEDRHVKWAPDVYDPPVTSVCHSINRSYHYQRRSKSRKKEKNKQKKKQKTKSKKGQQNSTLLQTPDPGSEDVGTSHSHGLGEHEAVTLDYSIGKETKCGSSFLRESVTKMHFSIGEAS